MINDFSFFVNEESQQLIINFKHDFVVNSKLIIKLNKISNDNIVKFKNHIDNMNNCEMYLYNKSNITNIFFQYFEEMNQLVIQHLTTLSSDNDECISVFIIRMNDDIHKKLFSLLTILEKYSI